VEARFYVMIPIATGIEWLLELPTRSTRHQATLASESFGNSYTVPLF
jgi:hypothetical protein